MEIEVDLLAFVLSLAAGAEVIAGGWWLAVAILTYAIELFLLAAFPYDKHVQPKTPTGRAGA